MSQELRERENAALGSSLLEGVEGDRTHGALGRCYGVPLLPYSV
ncbi:hypothetical protein D9611_000812 [Ephemerocybe angulata]|uniref:Uncharacterized protein n=1 Tax=Ephemerocybe angulata TaxID=980116 RepID=A0A8H5BN51_9AGAR|nr:hypothetical protein D9611_000812 [Tulosesus angulatus]